MRKPHQTITNEEPIYTTQEIDARINWLLTAPGKLTLAERCELANLEDIRQDCRDCGIDWDQPGGTTLVRENYAGRYALERAAATSGYIPSPIPANLQNLPYPLNYIDWRLLGEHYFAESFIITIDGADYYNAPTD